VAPRPKEKGLNSKQTVLSLILRLLAPSALALGVILVAAGCVKPPGDPNKNPYEGGPGQSGPGGGPPGGFSGRPGAPPGNGPGGGMRPGGGGPGGGPGANAPSGPGGNAPTGG
jgi:hypothetical protein